MLVYGGLDLEEKDLVVLEAQAGGGQRIDVEIGATAIEVKKKGRVEKIESGEGIQAFRIEAPSGEEQTGAGSGLFRQ